MSAEHFPCFRIPRLDAIASCEWRRRDQPSRIVRAKLAETVTLERAINEMSTPEAKPAAKKAAKKTARKAAAPKAGAAVNKSDAVREEATLMKARGEKPRPSVIVANLARKGIKVAPAQVSLVLKKMGFKPLRKGKGAKAQTAKKASAPRGAAKAAATGVVSVDDLVVAKKAAASLGGTEKAIAALQALKRIED